MTGRSGLFSVAHSPEPPRDPAGDALWLGLADGYCQRLGDQWTHWTGQPLSRLLGLGWIDFVHADDWPTVRSAWGRATRLRQSFREQFRLRNSDGSWRCVQAASVPYPDDDKLQDAWVGIVSDIDSDRRGEADRRDALQALSQHFATMPLACVVGDTDWRVLDWNRAAQKMFGWTLDEVRGRPTTDFLVGPDGQAVAESVRQALSSGEDGIRALNLNRTRDGRTVVCEWINTVVADAHGRTLHVGMAQDLTMQAATVASTISRAEGLLNLSHALVDEHEVERQLLAYALNNRIGQDVASVALRLAALAPKLASDDARAIVQACGTTLASVVTELRTRAEHLVPASLEDLGLFAATAVWAGQQASAFGKQVEVVSDGSSDAEPIHRRLGLFRAIQLVIADALAADGASQVRVALASSSGTITMTVDDDRPDEVDAADDRITEIRARVAMLDGTCIEERPDASTRRVVMSFGVLGGTNDGRREHRTPSG